MTESSTDHSTPAAVPDWSQIHRDMLCPLCGYNLRGLIEPRCPECGHGFVWSELFNEHHWQHKWLFEHQRQRRFRAFFRTLFASTRPARFWNAVFPSHRPRIWRLIVYWLVLTIPLGMMAVAYIAWPAVQWYAQVRQARQVVIDRIAAQPKDPASVRALQTYGTPAAVAAATHPMPSLEQFLYEIRSDRYRWWPLAGFALMSAAWPLVATLSFVVFRDTLRQARIKSIHVLRCAIYSADLGLILALGLIPLVRWRQEVATVGVGTHWIFAYTILEPVSICAVLLWLALLTYRLTTAYRMYLSFRHALLVAVWTQMIFFVLLCVMTGE